jgi:hypothetical protein
LFVQNYDVERGSDFAEADHPDRHTIEQTAEVVRHEELQTLIHADNDTREDEDDSEQDCPPVETGPAGQ